MTAVSRTFKQQFSSIRRTRRRSLRTGPRNRCRKTPSATEKSNSTKCSKTARRWTNTERSPNRSINGRSESSRARISAKKPTGATPTRLPLSTDAVSRRPRKQQDTSFCERCMATGQTSARGGLLRRCGVPRCLNSITLRAARILPGSTCKHRLARFPRSSMSSNALRSKSVLRKEPDHFTSTSSFPGQRSTACPPIHHRGILRRS